MIDWITNILSTIWGNLKTDSAVWSVIISFIVGILTLITVVYLALSFRTQSMAASVDIGKKAYNLILDQYEEVYVKISRNYANIKNLDHIILCYTDEFHSRVKFRKYLNEIEMICILIKTGGINHRFAFEMFKPMLMPCLVDKQIKSEYVDKDTLSAIQEVSNWCKKYFEHKNIFTTLYYIRGLYLLKLWVR